jgi:eukaryotic-like serine/threonine-protein kinase
LDTPAGANAGDALYLRWMSDPIARLNTALEGRYRVERELGAGGTATVYLAQDVKHDRRVALKVLHPSLGVAVGADRFLLEIRIAASLSHPNIVGLIDSGDADGLLYFVMFYVEGESLRDRLDRETQLPVEHALRIAREVGEALAYAHQMGIVHRDIKPENILLERGHARVADFGIAKALQDAEADRLTRTGLAIGTPRYMSPEQAAGDDEVDGRTDVYSLACVLYEMLSGAPPFGGATAHAILARKALEKPPGLRVVRSSVPESVEQAIERALSPTPADRQPSVEAFLAELEGEPRPAGLRAHVGRRWATAGVASLLAAGTVALFASSRAADGDRPPTVASFAQLTSEPGLEDSPCLSPDGAWLVYAGDGGGDRDIFLRSTGGQNPLSLTAASTADDTQPAFSRDGSRIAFRSERDGGGIFVMGRTGEGVRRVTDDGFNPAWSPDGTRLVYTLENVGITPLNMELSSDLWIVDIDGGEPRPLGVIDGTDPSWSPNGHRIAYGTRIRGEGASHLDVMTVPAGGGEPVPVTRDDGNDWSPAWSADGRHLWFVSDRGGSMNLWRTPIDEESGRVLGPAEPITAPAQFVAHPCVSADGRHVVFSSIVTTTQNVQRLAFDPSTEVVGETQWLTSGSRRWSNPDPTGDGARIVLYSQDRPEGDLYVMNGDGSGLRQLTADSAVDRVPRWSPDGRAIAYFSTRGGPLDVWIIRPDGSGNRQATTGGAGVPVWSPGGGRLAVTLLSGGTGLMDMPTSAAAALSVDALDTDAALESFNANAWSPDGRYLAGSEDYRDTGIIVYDIETGTSRQLTDFGQWPVFLPDSRRILFVTGGHSFHVVDLRDGSERRVYESRWDVIGPPRLTADGRQMLFTRRVTEGDVWLATLN